MTSLRLGAASIHSFYSRALISRSLSAYNVAKPRSCLSVRTELSTCSLIPSSSKVLAAPFVVPKFLSNRSFASMSTSEAIPPQEEGDKKRKADTQDGADAAEASKPVEQETRPDNISARPDISTRAVQVPKKRKSNKRDKKEIAFSHRRENNQEDEKPHMGSYAVASMRELYSVELPEPPAADDEAAKKSKKRAAFLIGYLGTNYSGFQMNDGMRTLQCELELALLRCNFISLVNFGYPSKYGWSTSGRTDKGVHACAQVCSAKMELAADVTMDQVRLALNEKLPADIRILDVVKVTRTFCAKTARERVRYQYMIPSFVFMDPVELQKAFDEAGCSNRHGRAPSDPLTPDEISKLQLQLNKFRATPQHIETLKKALQVYEGTHSFHNYAKGVTADEARATRFIESFHVEDPMVFDNGMEWIPTQVLGQSFLLHQIRKMISMVMDVARGVAPLDTVARGLSKEADLRVNLAPAQGLFMEMAFYKGYNRRKQTNPDLEDLNWTDEETPVYHRWKEFRNNTLMKHVVAEEEREGNFIKYLFVQEYMFNAPKMYQLDKTE